MRRRRLGYDPWASPILGRGGREGGALACLMRHHLADKVPQASQREGQGLRLDRYSLVAALAAALVLGQACFDARTASAQTCTPDTCVTTVGADGKGILGGGILGAEIGFIVPALIVSAGARELDEWWAWVLFPAIGAAAGAVGGYYALEEPVQAVDPVTGEPTQRGFPEAAVAVLAVSMALIVPTFVGVLALTTYNPGPDDSPGATGDEDAPPEEGGGEEEAPSAQSAIQRTLAGGPGLLRVDRGALLVGVPMVHSAPSFTAEERAHMRLGNMQDFRIPLVSGVW